MKKFFTLLFCVTVMGFGANAAETSDIVYKCIDKLLGGQQSTTIMATNLDANNDGVLNIADVTTLVDLVLQVNQPNFAPEQKMEVNTMLGKIVNNQPPVPTIEDVTKAIDQAITNKQE